MGIKIILTENQLNKILSEEKIYDDEKEYAKALERYEKRMKFYEFFNSFRKYENKKIDYLTLGTVFYENPTIKNWVNLKYTGDIMVSLDGCKDKRGSKGECESLYKSMGYPKIVGWYKVLLEDNEKYLKFNGESYIIKVRKPYTQNNNPGISGYIKDIGYFYMPIVQKPTKPILKKKSPTNTSLLSNQKPPSQNVKPNLDGQSVYGPANSLIGIIDKNRKFIPYDKQKTMNKTDRDLLNNKIELDKYLKVKFGNYISLN